MNNIQHEPLFTDLTPEQAAVVEGGASLLFTTKGVTTRLNIRSGPSTKSRIIGFWRPGEVKELQSPGIIRNGFRKFSDSQSMWVSIKFIQGVFGETGLGERPAAETGLGERPTTGLGERPIDR